MRVRVGLLRINTAVTKVFTAVFIPPKTELQDFQSQRLLIVASMSSCVAVAAHFGTSAKIFGP